MNIAGGVAAALFHRAQTGKATEVDVSLLSTAWWTTAPSINLNMEYGIVVRSGMPKSGSSPGNPAGAEPERSDKG